MKSQSTFLFTSESVGEGHPDKICDQVADAVLDECLRQNPLSKVAIEVAVRPGLVIVFGVVHFISKLDIDAIVRFVLKDIGYSSPDQELDYQTCEVMDFVELHPSLFNGISSGFEAPDNEPAGDQVKRSG
jgi:S-adenosylmethionine synthetase